LGGKWLLLFPEYLTDLTANLYEAVYTFTTTPGTTPEPISPLPVGEGGVPDFVDGDDDQSGDWEPFQEEQPPDAEQGVEQEGQDDWQGAQPVAEDDGQGVDPGAEDDGQGEM